MPEDARESESAPACSSGTATSECQGSSKFPGSSSFPYNEVEYKVLLAGDSGVGKSALASCMASKNILSRTCYNPSAEYQTRVVTRRNRRIRVRFFAGERIVVTATNVVRSNFKHADVIVLVYDITDKKTFVSLRALLRQARKYCNATTPIIVIGNKRDDFVQNREVPLRDLETFARMANVQAMETSAHHGFQLEEVFLSIVDAAERAEMEKLRGRESSIYRLTVSMRNYVSRCSFWCVSLFQCSVSSEHAVV